MAQGAAAATSQRNLDAEEKAAQAAALLRQGRTPTEVARLLGFHDRSGVRKAVMGLMQKLGTDDAQYLRDVQAGQLEEAIAITMDKLLAERDLQAVDRLVRLHERQARLLGLDAPSTVTSTLEVGESVTEVIESTQTRTLGDVLGLDTDEARQFARLVAPILARRKAAEQPDDEKGAQLVSTPEESA